MNDPAAKQKMYATVDNLQKTSENLAAFTAAAQSGQGILPRLLNDKAYADEALTEFNTLVKQLNVTVAKINNAEGTAGKIIADPGLYESINDILIGINESKLLRWLIRNRQQSGIERRVEEQKKMPETTTPPPVEPKAPDVPPLVVPEVVPPPTTDTTATTTDTTGTITDTTGT